MGAGYQGSAESTSSGRIDGGAWSHHCQSLAAAVSRVPTLLLGRRPNGRPLVSGHAVLVLGRVLSSSVT